MPLHDFLNHGANTHGREEIFNCRLLYDTKIAAAERGYHLRSYYSDVDHDGFDAILDDADRIMRLQLKTVLSTAATVRWNDIRKYVLRPTVRNWEMLGFEPGASPGVEGGVILMRLTVNGAAVDVEYFFTDVHMIIAIAEGIIARSPQVRNACQNLLTALGDGASHDTVAVTKPMFIRAATTDNLLSLMDLVSNSNTGWRIAIKKLANHLRGEADVELPAGHTVETLSESFRDMLRTASGQQNL